MENNLGFRNLSPDLTRADYMTMFTKFGKVTKLYIHPENKFGRVHYENRNHAYKARKELHNQSPWFLKFDGESTPVSENHVHGDQRTNTKNKRNMDYDGFTDVGKSNDIYVDAFGRVLDTFESDDGQIYVPVDELKRSGFHVALAGTLPKRSNLPSFDEKLFDIYKLYLEGKSNKFIAHNQLNFPEEKVKRFLAKLHKKFHDLHPASFSDRMVSTRNGSLTVTATSNRSMNINPQFQPKQTFNENTTSDRRSGFTNKSNGHVNDLFTSYQKSDGTGEIRSAAVNNNMVGGPQLNFQNTNSIKKISPEIIQSAQIASGPSKNTEPNTVADIPLKSVPSLFDVSPETAGGLRRPISTASSEPKPDIKPSVTNKQSAETQNIEVPKRGVVINHISSSGIFSYCETVNETTFIGLAVPEEFSDDLELLDRIINDCCADGSYMPNIGELVAVFHDDTYARAVIINNLNKIYKCALIDFGIIVTVTEVRRLPEQYKAIPDFAFMATTTPEILQELKNESDYIMIIKAPLVLTLTSRKSGKSHVINGYQWNPMNSQHALQKIEPTASIKEAPQDLPKSSIAVEEKSPKEQGIFKGRPKSPQLNESDVVIIIARMEGFLFVRTKDLNISLKKLKLDVQQWEAEPFRKPPVVNQVVLCPFDGEGLYRVIITSIVGPIVTVEYCDYGNCDKVAISDLRTINEELATRDCTLSKIQLQGFAASPFNLKATEFLHKCWEKKEKFLAVPTENDIVFKLLFLCDGSSLSEKLISLDPALEPTQALKSTTKQMADTHTEPPKVQTSEGPASTASATSSAVSSNTTRTPNKSPKAPKESIISLGDIPTTKLNKGTHAVLCMCCDDLAGGTVAVAFTNSPGLAETMGDVPEKIMEYIETDTTPYEPKMLEVCLAKYQGDWYRAAFITKVDGDMFGMFYIDFGNIGDVTKEDIRKMPRDFAKFERAAVICHLQGLTNDENAVTEPLLGKLTDALQDSSIVHNIEIVEIGDGIYYITFPELYKKWKQEGLL